MSRSGYNDEYKKKLVIIIGGSSGIGFATAQELLYQKVENIVIVSRTEEKLIKAKESLVCSNEQSVYTYPFDISDVSSHNLALKQITELVGMVPDGLVISSGVNFGSSNWSGFNISESDFDRVMSINLKGVFFLIRNFSNFLHGNKKKGNICVVSSISAHRDLLSVYQITKNAISGIVHAYGKHLGERGIILNCVEPGTTNTDMMKGLFEYTDGIRGGKEWKDNSIRRLIRPEEIAKIICFLMSDVGEVMSGSCVLAGGGCKSISR